MSDTKLILKDGTEYKGVNFGAPVAASGEVVFNTGMVGYVETLTDPSYAGEILVLTYPLVGNYGVPSKKFFESNKIQIAGLVVSEYSEAFSHSTAIKSLGSWLKENNIPAITGVDTRALTQKLRSEGVMLGSLSESDTKPKEFFDPNKENMVARVSIKKKTVYGRGTPTILVVDCGMKQNILRSFLARKVKIIQVPWDYDFTKEKYDGLFISNGPGDPLKCEKTISHIKTALNENKPTFGICLGTQLLALAAGGRTYKLKYGHRSQNQPCLDVLDGRRIYITSQNHGYAVSDKKLPKGWRVWFRNVNDGSVEGLTHASKPWKCVQFHPEASPGPNDTDYLFDDFVETVKKYRKKQK